MTFEDMRAVALHIGLSDASVSAFLPLLFSAAEKTGADNEPGLHLALQELRGWNGMAEEGSVGKRIFDAWMEELRQEVFGDEFGEAIRGDLGRLAQPSALLHALMGPNSSVPLSRDYLNGRGRDEVMVAALRKAIARLTAEDPVRVNWRHSQGTIDLSPLPPIPRTNRGTYISIVELAAPRLRSVSILPPGQSEDPQSPHYGDQREMAALFRFKPILYLPEQLGLGR